MQHQHRAYNGRNQVGCKSEDAKAKLPVEERRKRRMAKQLSKLFPGWKYHNGDGQTINIYQHFFSPKKRAV